MKRNPSGRATNAEKEDTVFSADLSHKSKKQVNQISCLDK